MLSLTPDARFITVYLYTNNHIGLLDTYKIPVQFIQLETGYDITSIKIVLDKLQELEIIKHYNYLWVKLLRADFASLIYSGEKNENAIKKCISEIPLIIRDYLESDTSIDTSMHTSHKSEIINHKSKIINKVEVEMPDWLDKSAWSNWVDYRKEIKKKLTPLMIKQQLILLAENKEDHAKIITTSIQNGWTGLFPLKSKEKQNNILKGDSNKYKKYDK